MDQTKGYLCDHSSVGTEGDYMPTCCGGDRRGMADCTCSYGQVDRAEGPSLGSPQGWQRTDAPPNDNLGLNPPSHIEMRAFFRLKMQTAM